MGRQFDGCGTFPWNNVSRVYDPVSLSFARKLWPMGQDDVAGYLAMACHILDGNVELLSPPDAISQRYS